MTHKQLKMEIGIIWMMLNGGCGNHGCRIVNPQGQGTNMICQCTPLRFSKRLLELAAEAEKQGREWEKS